MTRATTIRAIAGRVLTLGASATLAASLTIAGCTGADTDAQTRALLDRVSSDLPPEWVAQTRGSLAAAQDRRVDADATRIRADALYQMAMADADLDQHAAQTHHDAALIEAARRHAEADAANHFNRTSLEADARHADLDRLTQTDDLNALVERNSAELSGRSARAARQWREAQATHEQMVAERASTKVRGESAIAALEAQVEAARISAQHAAAEQRAAAQAAYVEAEARAIGLQREAESLVSTGAADIAVIRREAKATLAEARARSNAMIADAATLREVDAGTEHDAVIDRIEFEYSAGLDRVRLGKADAQVEVAKLDAELARRNGNIARSLERSRLEYHTSIFTFERVVEEGLAQAAQRRAHADFIERVTNVRAANIERQRTTDQILAEVLDGRRTAELSYARTETAARIRVAGAEDLVSLMNARRTDAPRTFERRGAHLWRGGIDRVTTAPVNGVYPANLDPSLLGPETGRAYADMLRNLADADERELHARVEQFAADFATEHAENLAQHDAMIVGLAGYQRAERARIEERFATADAQLIVVASERDRALAATDASRHGALAMADRLDAQVVTIDQRATDHARRALALAEALESDAAHLSERLEEETRLVLAAGAARRDQMLAEADAIEQDHLARLAAITTDLDAQRAALSAELAQLDAAAGTFAARSRAAYDEAQAASEAFRHAAEAEADELWARAQARHLIAQAGFHERRAQLDANETSTDAQRRRMVALAKETLERGWTDSSVARAQAAQHVQIARARADATDLLANAEESDAIAVFEAQLARRRAAKNQAYADLILAERASQRLAQDAAAAEQMHRALAEHALAKLELLENQRLDALRPVLVKFRDGTLIVRPERPNDALEDVIEETELADVPEPIDDR